MLRKHTCFTVIFHELSSEPVMPGMLTRTEVDKAEANSHEAEAKVKILAILFSQILHFDTIFSKKWKFLVNFRREFKQFPLKTALTWEVGNFISKRP